MTDRRAQQDAWLRAVSEKWDLEVESVERTQENEMATDEKAMQLYELLLTSGKMVDAAEAKLGRKLTEHDRTLAITLFLQKNQPARNGGGYRGNGGGPKKSNEAPEKCPKCGGPMWDNRADKRNPKAPDFKCKDRGCGEGVWLDSKKPEPANKGAEPWPDPFAETDDGLGF